MTVLRNRRIDRAGTVVFDADSLVDLLYEGFSDFGGFHIAQHGSATNTALYLSDSWRIGKWLFDLSGRLENQDATTNVCNLANVDLDGNP